MARLQLALDVTDLDEAVAFYTKLFGTAPAKLRPGYANFEITDPPLKLVLFEREAGGAINHLGVEVTTTDEVEDAERRLVAEGLAVEPERATNCCHAVQDKFWTTDPDGIGWEVYTVLTGSPVPVVDGRTGG